MAEVDDVTLDGKPLHSLRVADLKAALEQRGLAKSGQKNALIKRLKGALMLENLQRTSTQHVGLQPNSQIGEEMSQNSFIKQYLAKQQELLRQRLEREAREATEADERQSCAGDDDHMPSRGSTSCLPDKVRSQPSSVLGHEEVATPSPPRAVASLSVRVVGQPEHQGLPLAMPRSQEKEGPAPAEAAGTAHSVLQISRSAKAAASVQVDSDDEEEEDDDSDDDDEWGPSSHSKKNVRAPPVRPPPAAAPQRSRRKSQPPQHIPPQPQPVHQPPLQLRQPTPPPSPPPELSFPLPDTPKQSPRDQDEPAGPGEDAAPPLKRQDSSSSARSSSPEPPSTRRPGPLSLLVRKMESEGEFDGGQKVEMKEGGDVEVKEQEDSKAVKEPQVLMLSKEATVHTGQQNLAQQPLRPVSVPTMPSDQQDAPDSGSETRRGPQGEKYERKRGEEKVDESSAPFHMTSPSTGKPELVSGVTTGPECSQDVAMETEDSTTTPESSEEDKEIKALVNQAPSQSPRAPEEGKTSPSSQSPPDGETGETRNHSLKENAHEPHSSSSSSDSDSESSSSGSSSSPAQCKPRPHSQKDKEKEKRRTDTEEKKVQSSREIKQEALSEPAGQVSMELEGRSDSEGAAQRSDPQGAEASYSRPEESSAAKLFAARKISLNSKTENASCESESVGGASRKRRWGSSTAVTAKKPSISITTDSLKTLIPEIKPLQEAVVELHPDESHLSSEEDSAGPHDLQEPEEDQGLKIRRTVTQVVSSDGQENGEEKMEDDDDDEEQKWTGGEKEKPRKRERSSNSTMETEDDIKVSPNDSLVRRSVSQQKSSVLITVDDPIRTGRQLSPPRGKTSNIIHVSNLVRPFTLGQLKELLNRTGTMVEEGFWIDKIKSHCYVTYSTAEEAIATREALHGVKWPASNPKVLRVDFCEQDELDFHKGLLPSNRTGEGHDPQASEFSNRPAAPPPPKPTHRVKEKEREKDGGDSAVKDLWAERERAMERRERTRSEREWDRDKVKDFGREDKDGTRRSRSRDRRRRERGRSKEKRTEKKDKPEEPPAKLLDDLFCKTKAAPCIYWLPLTEEQVTQRALERAERRKEREKRRKELQEEEDKKREERRERAKGRDREGGATGGGGGAGSVVGRSAEGERDRGKEKERERGREGEKRRDSQRERRGSDSKPAGGSRRSRSHSNTSRGRRH